jgi:hypothetical protein
MTHADHVARIQAALAMGEGSSVFKGYGLAALSSLLPPLPLLHRDSAPAGPRLLARLGSGCAQAKRAGGLNGAVGAKAIDRAMPIRSRDGRCDGVRKYACFFAIHQAEIW